MCVFCIITLLTGSSVNNRWPDSLNVRFVGNWPFGPSHAVLGADYFVLLASGGGIYVVNIDDPTQPTVVSDTMRTRGFVTSMRVMYLSPPAAALYVGAGVAGIEVWDVLDLPIAERTCAFNTPGYVNDYDATGTFRQYETYVAAGDSGLRIVNLYSQPEEVGFYDTPGSAQGLRYDYGPVVYIADGFAGLRVINVSDPANPFEAGFYDTPGYAHAVDVNWDFSTYYAYVADGNNGICILDIIDPSIPQFVSQYYTGDYVYNVEVVESYLYISKDYYGFEATTLTPPLQHIDSYNTPGYARDADYSYYQQCALIADWHEGLRLIDVSGPFQEIGHLDVPDKTYSICVDASHAYIANRHGGLRILDVTEPAFPCEAGYCPTPGYAVGVDIADTHAYIADYNTGLTVVDVTTPANPQIVGSCDTPGNAWGVHVQDSLAYVADDTEGLRIINVADPSNPFEIGFLNTPGCATSVYAVDSFAYIADGSGSGLRVVDVSTPSSPQERGFCMTPGNANDVYVTGIYAYIADGLAGLRIIDVAESSNPHEVGYLDTPGYAHGVCVCDSFCYISDSASLRIVNISTPTNPQEVGYYSTPDCAYDIDIQNAYLYVADGCCGVQVYENTIISGVKESDYITPGHRLQLGQNPVHAEHIVVRFYKTQSEKVGLDMYNILGQRIKTMDFSHLPAGYHTMKIPINNMTNGIYFLKFSAREYTETNKLLLLR